MKHERNRLVLMGALICCAAVSISCGSGSSPASSGRASSGGQVYMLCSTTPDRPHVFLSAVFPLKSVTPTRMIEQPWAQEFRTYVGQANGNEMGLNVSCDQVASKDAEKQKADELRKQGHQVTETNWVYAGG